MATSYADVFGGSTVQPGDVEFRAVALSASITTVWPAYATTGNQLARIMKVTPSAGSLTVTLPDATLVGAGQDVLFDNPSATTFTVLDSAGNSVATLTSGQVKYFYLSDNSTAAGTWRVTLFGVGSSSPDASQLVGYGLKAIGATLNFAPVVVDIAIDTTVVAADRTKVYLWTGGSGILTLPTTAGSTSDWSIEIRNQGTGTLTITPAGGVLIDGSASIALVVNESCFVHMGATDWYTVGRGRNTSFNFTRLAKVIDGGTDTLTLTEASNVVQTYTGALLSNQTVNFPAVVQVYYVVNNTTGVYALTFGCVAGGTSVVVGQTQAAVLFCDGTNVINANTMLAGAVATVIFGAGTAANPSVAIATSDNGFYSPATDQVALSINGAQSGLWTATGYTITGSGEMLQTVSSTAAGANYAVSRAAGQTGRYRWRTAGVDRFTLNVNATAETGANAGSNLELYAYDDAGASLGTVFTVDRATRALTFTVPASNAIGAITRDARTSNTILTAADVGKLIDITSGTFSQTFTAAATLGSGWFVYIKNSGTGEIALDPNGAELINEATTFSLPTLTTCLVQCTGAEFTVVYAQPDILLRQPIFSAISATSNAVSSTEEVANSYPLTGIGSVSIGNVIFGNSLFLVAAGAVAAAQSNIASSPDGVVYTLRPMPSNAVWVIGTNGTNKFVACVPGATTTAKSTDGTTWVAGTALGAAAVATKAFPVFVGDRVLVESTTASTCYWSDDNGATWTAATTPTTLNASARIYSVGGLFWFYSATTVAYTSATGATGAWTVQALPITPAIFFQATDGSLWIAASSATVWYKTTDGINWVVQTAIGTAFGLSADSNFPIPINGVNVNFNTTFGSAGTYHNGLWTMRRCQVVYGTVSYLSMAQNAAGTIFVLPVQNGTTGNVIYIEPAATTAPRALFSA